jgi:ribonuclease HI
MVVRDAASLVVATAVRSVLYITDPTVAEAMGAWHAFSLCRALGLSKVVFEGDSSIVVAALNNENPTCSSYGHIVVDTRSLFQSFHAVEIRHVQRVANTAAHVLAKFALVHTSDFEWLGACPQQISQIVSLI